MKQGDPPIVVQQTFDRPASDVWQAITDVTHMVRWFFDRIPAFEPVVGFETGFDVINEGRRFPHRWRVTETDPERMLRYDWRYEGYEGAGIVTFHLDAESASTTLTVTFDVVESFQDGIPEFSAEACRGGWVYFIQERLAGYLRETD